MVIVVSAPGKILLAGGYLVLDDENCGLVIAVNRRFYCECDVKKLECATTETSPRIIVDSPQFECQWLYSWKNNHIEADEGNMSSNGFVEKTLSVVLSFLSASESIDVANSEIRLRVAADNDFYSLIPHLKNRNLNLCDGSMLSKCLPAAKEENGGGILKTGLGSSACLVTAIVAAILKSFKTFRTETICALAQVSHCYAQGKVGSGFDVSAACFGSHVYQRFPKNVLTDVLKALEDNEECGSQIVRIIKESQLLGCGVQQPIQTFHDNSFLQIMMADVSMGSESPSMARRVLKWKQEQMAPVPYWSDLAKLNPRIIDLFAQLENVNHGDDVRSKFASMKAEQWSSLDTMEITPILLQLRDAFCEVRRNLKCLGESAGVPVEPDVQSALCDATTTLPGVLATLVPGAGGYDAVACVYVNEKLVHDSVARFWATEWKQGVVCALTVSGSSYGEGLKEETEFPIAGQ